MRSDAGRGVTPIGPTELREGVIAWVRGHSLNAEAAARGIGQETDLLGTGLLDSVGFVELVAWTEAQLGREIDLAEADPDEFTTVDGFCRLALRRGAVGGTRDPA